VSVKPTGHILVFGSALGLLSDYVLSRNPLADVLKALDGQLQLNGQGEVTPRGSFQLQGLSCHLESVRTTVLSGQARVSERV